MHYIIFICLSSFYVTCISISHIKYCIIVHDLFLSSSSSSTLSLLHSDRLAFQYHHQLMTVFVQYSVAPSKERDDPKFPPHKEQIIIEYPFGQDCLHILWGSLLSTIVIYIISYLTSVEFMKFSHQLLYSHILMISIIHLMRKCSHLNHALGVGLEYIKQTYDRLVHWIAGFKIIYWSAHIHEMYIDDYQYVIPMILVGIKTTFIESIESLCIISFIIFGLFFEFIIFMSNLIKNILSDIGSIFTGMQYDIESFSHK